MVANIDSSALFLSERERERERERRWFLLMVANKHSSALSTSEREREREKYLILIRISGQKCFLMTSTA